MSDEHRLDQELAALLKHDTLYPFGVFDNFHPRQPNNLYDVDPV